MDTSDYQTDGSAEDSTAASTTEDEADCDDISLSQSEWMAHCAATAAGDDGHGASVAEAVPDRIRVPDFVGREVQDSQATLMRSGMKLCLSHSTHIGYDYSVSCYVQKQDTILEQQPRARTLVRPGTTVHVTLAC